MLVESKEEHESHKREWQFLSFTHVIITISHKPAATSAGPGR